MAGSSTGSSGSSSGGTTATTPVAPPSAISVPFWDTNEAGYAQFGDPSPWLKGKLAGKDCPGTMDVTIPGATRKVDAQSPSGKNGAKIVIKGVEPSKVTVKITLWTSDQWTAWLALEPKLSVKLKESVTIYHPKADLARISNILITKEPSYEDGTPAGTKIVTFEGIDSGDPKASGTGTAKNGGKPDYLIWFELYQAYVIGIRNNSGGGGYWLTWSTWIMQQGQPQLCAPSPPGYAAWAPPGMP